MRLGWATDIHLDFVQIHGLKQLIRSIKLRKLDALALTGDIATAGTVATDLLRFREEFKIPIYFVLGNHDFYGGSIAEVRERIIELTQIYPDLVYLTCRGVISLNKKTAIIGHDGWPDGKAGDFFNSRVSLRDFYVIQELINLSRDERYHILNRYGEDAADQAKEILLKALEDHEQVIMLTHVPPYRGVALYQNKPTEPEWAPYFVSISMGEMITEVMAEYPDQHLLVLCGHTHSRAEYSPLANVKVIAGEAEYGDPALQQVFEI
jgi:Icc-related predicted phosphoesterase